MKFKKGTVKLIIKEPLFLHCSVCGELKEKKLEFVSIEYNCACDRIETIWDKIKYNVSLMSFKWYA